MADRKRATGGGQREGMMCDVLIFGARTPGYDNDDAPDRGSRIEIESSGSTHKETLTVEISRRYNT
jgi:hypothetical protein